jgi:methanethiol S-methyltransferase
MDSAAPEAKTAIARDFTFGYCQFCYVAHWAVFLYMMGFLIDYAVPLSIDKGRTAPLATSIIVDVSILALFISVHWVAAQQWFTDWWVKIVPPPAERSTYVLISAILLSLTFYLWLPIPTVLWHVEPIAGRLALLTLYWAGWMLAIVATFPINHWYLFGVRQGYLFLQGIPYSEPHTYDSILYRYIPHPIFVGYLLTLWATPHMTVGHAIFAAMLTGLVTFAVRIGH